MKVKILKVRVRYKDEEGKEQEFYYEKENGKIENVNDVLNSAGIPFKKRISLNMAFVNKEKNDEK